ncbi:MAG TPA: exodeoxyribonuclease VII small subunit [Hyphomicrobiales bacterium]|jgi:exodeoxyribonuclease VII small subunit
MANGPTIQGDIQSLSFEQALKELEQIVGKLERGDVELEPSIALYERGEALRAHCEQLLQRIEAKVEKITLDAQGNPNGSAPFEA